MSDGQTCSWSWYQSGVCYANEAATATTGTSAATPLACIGDEYPYIDWSKGFMNPSVYGYKHLSPTKPANPEAYQWSDYGTDSYFGQGTGGYACEAPTSAGLQTCGNVASDDEPFCTFQFDTTTGHTYVVGNGYAGSGTCDVSKSGCKAGTGAASCCPFNVAYCAELDETNSWCARAQCVFTHNPDDPGGGTAEPNEETSSLLKYRILDTWVARSGYGASISPRCACNLFGAGPDPLYGSSGEWMPVADCTDPQADLKTMDIVTACSDPSYVGLPCTSTLKAFGCTCDADGVSPLAKVFETGVIDGTDGATLDGLAGLASRSLRHVV